MLLAWPQEASKDCGPAKEETLLPSPGRRRRSDQERPPQGRRGRVGVQAPVDKLLGTGNRRRGSWEQGASGGSGLGEQRQRGLEGAQAPSCWGQEEGLEVRAYGGSDLGGQGQKGIKGTQQMGGLSSSHFLAGGAE